MSELEEKKKRKKRKKLVLNLPKNLLSVIGLKEKELKERKVDGLIVMHQMEKAVTNPVVVHLVKNVRNILHVDQPLVHARKEVVENHGVKKVQKERGKMSQWKCH